MKIEKINDNQIRCTLTHEDLEERKLQLSELAYGTEKAKSLFRDMMQQAAVEFGFEANDMPLMIEAIPSADSIVLVITKVEDPEELDTRFSRFAPSSTGSTDTPPEKPASKLDGAESLKNLLDRLKSTLGVDDQNTADNSAHDQIIEIDAQDSDTASSNTSSERTTSSEKKSEKTESNSLEFPSAKIRLFSFGAMDHVLSAARMLAPMYHGASTLYKDLAEDTYLLALTRAGHSAHDFSSMCNMLSEYGTSENHDGPILAFLEEHCEVIVANDAVHKLASV